MAPSTSRLTHTTHHQTINVPATSRAALLCSLARPGQWVKNILVFAPLVLSHRWSDLQAWTTSLIGFGVFSLCASATYVWNDLVDREFDRLHPEKRLRPLASGALPVSIAWPFAVILALLGLGLAGALNWRLQALMGVYFVLNQAYSRMIKRLALLDVMTLAVFYILRMLAGGISSGVPISMWLLAMGACLFLSLALAKRAAELTRLKPASDASLPGRAYVATDLLWIRAAGGVSGLATVGILAAYSVSSQMSQLYVSTWPLLVISLLVGCWIHRTWGWALSGTFQGDPVVFATRDRVSYVLGALCLVLLVYAAAGANT